MRASEAPEPSTASPNSESSNPFDLPGAADLELPRRERVENGGKGFSQECLQIMGLSSVAWYSGSCLVGRGMLVFRQQDGEQRFTGQV